MKLLLLATLLLAVFTYTSGYPYSGACCGTSRCRESALPCCGRSSQLSCCTGGGTSCCLESESSSLCCRQSSNRCSEECKDSNFSNRCCCSYPEPTPIRTTSQSPLLPLYSSTYPPNLTTYYPPNPILSTPSSSNTTNISKNSNNITIPTNINILNEVRSETHITVPVSVLVNNVNNIDVHQASDKISPGENCTRENSKEDEACVNKTIIKTVTVRVPVPVPVYRTIPVPYIVIIPKPVPMPVGCCQIIEPCAPYTYGGCQTFSNRCSHQCSNLNMYHPRNVCQTGCYRRDIAMGLQCGHNGCSRGQVDCSMCNDGFYNNYDTFLMCSGCFVPMPWGMG